MQVPSDNATQEPLSCPTCQKIGLRWQRKQFATGVGVFQCDHCQTEHTGVQTPSGEFIPLDCIHGSCGGRDGCKRLGGA